MYTEKSSLKRIATEDINERSSKLVCKTAASLSQKTWITCVGKYEAID